MGNWKLLTIVALLGAVGGGVATSLYESKVHVTRDTPVQVMTKPVVEITASAQAKSQEVSLVMTGQIESEATVQLVPQLSGIRIQDVLVKEGQLVKKGQPLVKLDSTVQQLAAYSASNQVEKVRQQKIVLEAQLVEAASVLSDAETQLQRALTLESTGTQSREQVEAKQLQVKSAKRRVQELEAQLKSAAADAVIASNDKKSADIREGYAVLTAPIDGIVGNIGIKAGDITGTGSVLTIESSKKQLRFNVPSDIVDTLKSAPLTYEGTPVSLRGLAVKDGVYTGVVAASSEALLGASGTVSAMVRQHGVKVPVNVLKKDSQGWYIWGVQAGKASKVHVELATPVGEQAVIVTPLPANFDIIVSGTDFLYEGLELTVKERKV